MLLSYFFLQNAWHFSDRYEVQEIKDKSIQEIVAKSVQSQAFNALKNFTDIGN